MNSLTWHDENDSSSVVGLPGDVQDARTSFVTNPRYAPLKINRIDVNEIVGPTFIHQPAGTLAYYGAIEVSGATAGAHSCWVLNGGTGADECYNGTISGLLTADTFQPRSVWWLHKSYADGVSGRVQAPASNPQIVALASNSITGAATPQILVGNWSYQNTVSGTPNPVNVNLSLTNLQALSAVGRATSIDLRVELIPDTEMAALSQLQLIGDTNVSTSGGALQFVLPALQIGQVFRVTLNPIASQLSFTSPPANGSTGTAISPGSRAGAGYQRQCHHRFERCRDRKLQSGGSHFHGDRSERGRDV